MTSEKQKPGARTKAVDDPPALRLLLPSGLVGVNDFATPQWWAGCEAQLATAGIIRAEQEYAAGRATVVTVPRPAPGIPVLPDGDRVLAVVPPVRDWLGEGPLEKRLDRLVRWREGLLSWTEQGHVVVLATEQAPAEVAALAAGAAGIRWPLLDLTMRQSHGSVPSEGGLAGRFADAMSAAIGDVNRGAWITRDLALEDAARVVALGCDQPAISELDAERLRVATQVGIDRVVAAGIQIVGPRELLRWPTAGAAGSLPLDIAAEAALAVLEGVPERVDPITLGTSSEIAEVAELQQRVEERRAELSQLMAATPSADKVGKKELLRRLVGRKHG